MNNLNNLSIVREYIKGEKDYQYAKRVASMMVEMLEESGEIYIANDQLYYFDNKSKVLLFVDDSKVNNSKFQKFLILEYNFSISDIKGKIVYERLTVDMSANAKPANIHSFYHYNKESNIWYFRVSSSRLGKLTTNALTYHYNGFEGVIFKDNSWSEDLKEVEMDIGNDKFSSEYIKKIWFEDSERYPAKYQRVLFYQWCLYTVLQPESTNRPILVLQGERGTGKTSTLLAFGKMLFGKHFSAGEVPNDMRDFHNALLNNELIIIDNFDEKAPDQFIDQITRLTTGGGINRRPLYSDVNAESIREDVYCSIASTTRTQQNL